jgi:hypothetical protein
MRGTDLPAVRERLGELWNVGRPLRPIELGRACGFVGRRAWEAIARWEARDDELAPPVSTLLEAMLSGAFRPEFRKPKMSQEGVKTD